MKCASNVLMIEPVAFGFNEETAKNNYFQQNDETPEAKIQAQALAEFRGMVELLRANGINVMVEKDTLEPHTPDSIFPNNWVSFHSCGKVVLYPMFAENRRAERRPEILERLSREGFEVKTKLNLTGYERAAKPEFLEGTGSIVLDRDSRAAYACLSPRTSKNLFEIFCRELDYQPIVFKAFHNVDGMQMPIYHTNVMMCVADRYVIVCLSAINDRAERAMVEQSIIESGKELIKITESQMHSFAGNMLQLCNADGEKFLVMSEAARSSLEPEQIAQIESYNKILSPAIPTIERYGGGSARCMIAEVFLRRK